MTPRVTPAQVQEAIISPEIDPVQDERERGLSFCMLPDEPAPSGGLKSLSPGSFEIERKTSILLGLTFSSLRQ
jgi:hypothetical protein